MGDHEELGASLLLWLNLFAEDAQFAKCTSWAQLGDGCVVFDLFAWIRGDHVYEDGRIAGKAEDEVAALFAPSPPLGAYAKILLSYAQTLGALASYVTALLPPGGGGASAQLSAVGM